MAPIGININIFLIQLGEIFVFLPKVGQFRFLFLYCVGVRKVVVDTVHFVRVLLAIVEFPFINIVIKIGQFIFVGHGPDRYLFSICLLIDPAAARIPALPTGYENKFTSLSRSEQI